MCALKSFKLFRCITLNPDEQQQISFNQLLRKIKYKKTKLKNNEEEESTDDLNAWTKNKLRGFRRVSPGSPAESNNENKKAPETKRPTPNPTSKSVPPLPPTITPTPTEGRPTMTFDNGRKLYCHFFVNQGKCTHEERTGDKCKFEHEKAPMCRSGMSCSRAKYMYSHPNIGGMRMNQNFLSMFLSMFILNMETRHATLK